MFGLGFSEIVVIGVLALILLGPEQLPDLARKLGRFINDLKRTTDDLKSEFKNSGINPQNLLEEIRREPPGKQTPENLHTDGHNQDAHSGHDEKAHQPLDNTKPAGNDDSGKT